MRRRSGIGHGTNGMYVTEIGTGSCNGYHKQSSANG